MLIFCIFHDKPSLQVFRNPQKLFHSTADEFMNYSSKQLSNVKKINIISFQQKTLNRKERDDSEERKYPVRWQDSYAWAKKVKRIGVET